MQQSIKQEIFTVTQLSLLLKQHVERLFPAVAVQGEVSNLKEQASGHLYFTLKDAESQVSAVLFKGNTRALAKLPKNGDQVIVKGEMNVYPPRGYYQIIVRELNYAGVGALLLKLHEMKLLLQERGWFSKAHKKTLPKYPKTLGVVTSPTGSVIQDILHILTRRLNGFHLILNPVKVQGEGAAEEIASAIRQFNQFQLADVLIVGRGGGSLEDLWAFNEEKVAAAIFHSQIPIISAVGHETDYCIADFVADVRAPTPSAAAEIATTEKAHQLHVLSQTLARLNTTLKTAVHHNKKQLDQLKRHPYLSSPYALLSSHLQRMDDLTADVEESMLRQRQEKRTQLHSLEKQIRLLNPKNQLVAVRQKMQSCHKKLDPLFYNFLAAKKEKLSQCVAHLKAIDPKNLLAKGYSLLFRENALVISVHELKNQDELCAIFHDGKALLNVLEVKQEP